MQYAWTNIQFIDTFLMLLFTQTPLNCWSFHLFHLSLFRYFSLSLYIFFYTRFLLLLIVCTKETLNEKQARKERWRGRMNRLFVVTKYSR